MELPRGADERSVANRGTQPLRIYTVDVTGATTANVASPRPSGRGHVSWQQLRQKRRKRIATMQAVISPSVTTARHSVGASCTDEERRRA
jgi:hypothetical protein